MTEKKSRAKEKNASPSVFSAFRLGTLNGLKSGWQKVLDTAEKVGDGFLKNNWDLMKIIVKSIDVVQ